MATYAKSATAYLIPVSVPFTRGTPPWPLPCSYQMAVYPSFSPLHEGDTSVATAEEVKGLQILSFSPLHEGDTSVAASASFRIDAHTLVSVPFTRGTPPWLPMPAFDHLTHITVSVPFTRGTPPWLADAAIANRSRSVFQSPSRGGHLRGGEGCQRGYA